MQTNQNTFNGEDSTQSWKTWLTPDPAALAVVPRSLAWEAGILPLKMQEDRLVVATTAPLDLARLGQFQIAIQRPILYFEAPRAAFQEAMFAVYGHTTIPELERLVDAVSAPPVRHEIPQNEEMVDLGPRMTRFIGVTSGKGGAGKTNVAANLAVALSDLGLKVALIDADFGMANLHLTLGVSPDRTLADVAAGTIKAVDALTIGPKGVRLLAGSAGMPLMDYPKLKEFGGDFEAFRGRFDYVIVDTAAGAHDAVITLLAECDETLMVMTPEPSSVHDAYVTAKALRGLSPKAKIDCIMNRTDNESEAKMIFAKFQTVLNQSGQIATNLIGYIEEDDVVFDAGRARQPFVVSFPRSRAAKQVVLLARKVAGFAPATATAVNNPIQRLFSRFKIA